MSLTFCSWKEPSTSLDTCDLESESRWNSITWSDWWQSDSVSGNWTNESIGASSETWDVDSEQSSR
jgi:hypothetical protein